MTREDYISMNSFKVFGSDRYYRLAKELGKNSRGFFLESSISPKRGFNFECLITASNDVGIVVFHDLFGSKAILFSDCNLVEAKP